MSLEGGIKISTKCDRNATSIIEVQIPRRQLDIWVWDSRRDEAGDENLEIISESCLKPCNWVESSGNEDRLKRQDLEFSIPAYQHLEVRKKGRRISKKTENQGLCKLRKLSSKRRMRQTFRERKGLKEPWRDEEKDLSSCLEWTSILFPVQHPAPNLSLGSPETEPEKELSIKALLSGAREWGKQDGHRSELIKAVLSLGTLEHDVHYYLTPSLRKEVALCALESNSH